MICLKTNLHVSTFLAEESASIFLGFEALCDGSTLLFPASAALLPGSASLLLATVGLLAGFASLSVPLLAGTALFFIPLLAGSASFVVVLLDGSASFFPASEAFLAGSASLVLAAVLALLADDGASLSLAFLFLLIRCDMSAAGLDEELPAPTPLEKLPELLEKLPALAEKLPALLEAPAPLDANRLSRTRLIV